MLEYQNNVTSTRYYAGSYEKTMIETPVGTVTQEVHYISCGNGVNLAYVVEGSTSAYHYLHTDYLGSILAVSDATGTLEYEQNFDAWGRDRNPADWSYTASTTPRPSWLYRGFTGHEHLREFTLINMNARMYDPEVGRMLAVDNYVLDPHNSQDYNRYSYARNNPLKYSDPSGESVIVAVAAGAIVGAYLGGSSANGTFNPGKWDYSSSSTWIGIGTGALMGGLSGGLAATGQLSFAAGVTVGGVSIGGIALNNSGSNYDLNLFAGSSSSGYNYNLGSAKNRKYNPDPFASDDAYVDYKTLPNGPKVSFGPSNFVWYEFTDEELREMGKNADQIDHYRKTGNFITHEEALALSATKLPLDGMNLLIDWASAQGNIGKAAKTFNKAIGMGSTFLGIPTMTNDVANAWNNPSAGTILKASISVGTTAYTTFRTVNPYARGLMLGYDGVMFILDANKIDPYKTLDDNLDRISW